MWVLATLMGLAMLVILLSVPVDLAVRVITPEKTRVRLGLRWLFGLVDWEIKTTKRSREVKAAEAKPKGRRTDRAKILLALLGTRGLRLQLLKLVRNILPRLKIRGLKIDLRLGLDDPASTGLLFAIIGPPLAIWHPSSVKLTPSFEGAAFTGELSGRLRVIPGQLVIAVRGNKTGLGQVAAETSLVLETPLSLGEVTLIPVTRVVLGEWSSKRGVSFLAHKSPVAVVVVSPDAKRALSVSGEEISLAPLIEEVPDLAEALKKASR